MIGGDGTLMAATKIVDAIAERGLKISVVGIPKTIDNDIYMVSRSFGFDSAVDVATMAIRAAPRLSTSFRAELTSSASSANDSLTAGFLQCELTL